MERTFQWFGDEAIPRGEVGVEPAMRETSVLHEFSHAERIDAMLAYLSRRQFQDLLERLCLFCLGMPHCPDLQRQSFESAYLAWVCMLADFPIGLSARIVTSVALP